LEADLKGTMKIEPYILHYYRSI